MTNKKMISGWLICLAVFGAFLPVTGLQAQKRNKKGADHIKDLIAIREWYRTIPLTMNLHISKKVVPELEEVDDDGITVEIQYGPSEFYLKSGLVEQFIKDSFQVIVNSDANIIQIFPNAVSYASVVDTKLGQGVFIDSVSKDLAKKYVAERFSDSAGVGILKLSSKTIIPNTDLTKEDMLFFFDAKSHKPLKNIVTRRVLVPVEEQDYTAHLNDTQLKGRLVKLKGDNGDYYFLAKEEVMTYEITIVNNKPSAGMVKLSDRIIRNQDGSFSPAAGFADYLISIEE